MCRIVRRYVQSSLRLSVPDDPLETGAWPRTPATTVALAPLLLLGTRQLERILLASPLSVLLVGLLILAGNLRGPSQISAPALEKSD